MWEGRKTRTPVIPRCAIAHRGCAFGRRPGIHNHGRGLWIPGSMLRIAPECRLGVVLRFAMTVTPHSRGEAIGSINRHCERSEAIHGTSATKMDCFAALAMTANGPSCSLLCADVVR